MRKEDFLNVVHLIDDELIEEAVETERKHSRRWKATTSLLVVVGIGTWRTITNLQRSQEFEGTTGVAGVHCETQSRKQTADVSNIYHGNGT